MSRTNRTELVTEISQKSGVDFDSCEKIIQAFEDAFGDALSSKFKGERHNEEYVVNKVAENTEISPDICKKVLDEFEEAFGEAIINKFRFKKNKD